jgi:hypothetical protein
MTGEGPWLHGHVRRWPTVANTAASCAPAKLEHNPGNQRADELYGTKADTTQKKREREAQHKGLAMVKRSRRCS